LAEYKKIKNFELSAENGELIKINPNKETVAAF